MKLNKKGSLNLSINAIVILILAITMLGLGLAFIRNIFGSATEEFEDIGGEVKKQMIEEMKASDDVVELSRPKVELKAGASTQLYIGFKNEGNTEMKFKIHTDGVSEPTSLGGDDNCNLTYDADSSKQVYLEFKTAETTVLKGDVVVLPINIKTTSDAEPDTCFYELKVGYGTTTDDTNSTIELTVDIES